MWPINATFFDKLPKDVQQILMEESKKAGAEMTRLTLASQDDYPAKFKAAGVTIVSDVDIPAFQKATASVYKAFPKWTPGLRETQFLIALTQQPWLLLLLVNLGLIVVGMLIEGTAALILLTPILVPAVTKLGLDPLHFGLIIVVNPTLGGVTPPVGTMMFTTCSIMRVKIKTFVKEGWPFRLALLAVLMLVTYLPALVVWLPTRLVGP